MITENVQHPLFYKKPTNEQLIIESRGKSDTNNIKTHVQNMRFLIIVLINVMVKETKTQPLLIYRTKDTNPRSTVT